MATDLPANQLVSPFDLQADDGYVWLRGNLHCHTTNSDGKPSPQERLDGYVEQGYDFLCLSDHYTITRIETVRAPDDFVLVQGVELHPENPFGGLTHHFVCLNIHEDMDTPKMPPQHVIDKVNEQGGSIWLAHPHWSSVKIIRDTLPLHGLAGIEVFNTICRTYGRGESSVHWDDWMELENRLYPALANDDSHALESQNRDTYRGWTMARVKNRSPQAIVDALAKGTSYSSTGVKIHNISLHKTTGEPAAVNATVECSESRCILAICDTFGTEYRGSGKPFTRATLTLRPGARWVRFEVIGTDGTKAWSNPFDLT
jgi:hypothetical protein